VNRKRRDWTGVNELTVGCCEKVRGGSGVPLRKAHNLYVVQRNQALREAFARRTTAQGARHVKRIIPKIAYMIRRETKKVRRIYGIYKIETTRSAVVKEIYDFGICGRRD